MPFIDPAAASRHSAGGFEPGVYLCEVSESELKRSKTKGEEYFGVKLQTEGKFLCHDVLMLEGGGARFGIPKLKALGFFADGPQDVSAAHLIGRRAWVRVDWQRFRDEEQLKPVSVFEPEFDCGWYPEDSPPDDATDAVFDPEPAPKAAKPGLSAEEVDRTPF